MIGGFLLLVIGLLVMAEATAPALHASSWPARRRRGFTGLACCALGILILSMAASARAPSPAAPLPLPAVAPRVVVPDASAMYRRWVEQAVAEEWGVDGSPARLAAQLHQESSWNPRAHSAAGAEGLAQFMPATARWIAQQFPNRLGGFDPWDPQQAALAAAVYDAWLVKRNPGATACSTWAFALSAYNGGERALRTEQAQAGRTGRDPRQWFGQVARMRARSTAAWRENRDYVRRILTVLEPAYLAAGWSGEAVCT
jgi:soluble lytic murein transglycosylase-like protein